MNYQNEQNAYQMQNQENVPPMSYGYPMPTPEQFQKMSYGQNFQAPWDMQQQIQMFQQYRKFNFFFEIMVHRKKNLFCKFRAK